MSKLRLLNADMAVRQYTLQTINGRVNNWHNNKSNVVRVAASMATSWLMDGYDLTMVRLDLQSVILVVTEQLVDAACMSSCLLPCVFWNITSKWNENANK